jgi:hypothetical protein
LASFGQVERVGDLAGGGQHRVERQPPRAREIQHRPADRVPPRGGHRREPGAQPPSGAAFDDIEELVGGDIDDRGRPRLGPPPALTGEEHLVHAEGLNGTDPALIDLE